MPDDLYLQLPNVGRCQVLAKIGEGGVGAVYRGRHRDLDIDVAIKFLHPDRVRDAGGSERFLQEARLAARLNHPGIVRVFDCGEVDGHYFIVMEYVDGQTLAAHIADMKSLPAARSIQIATAVAESLRHAMDQFGVIHRDIKPANILLAANGDVKLADLGLAKIVSSAAWPTQPSGYTSPGVALGTPRYMSPEQFSDASKVDHRSDIYSLGATLYHMLSGEAPFLGESIFSILKQVEEVDPAPLPHDVPIYVQEIVLQMMAKRAVNRFQTYTELIGVFQDALSSLENESDEATRTELKPVTPSMIPAAKTSGKVIRSATPVENRALLVVDIQNDFCPRGALAVPEGDQVVPIINRLARRFAHVILTQDWHCEDHLSFASSHPGSKPLDLIELSYGPQILWPDHCVQGTPGAQFHPDLRIDHCELVIRKGYHREIDSYSAFFENDRQTPTGLAGYLRERGLSRLFIVGLATDFCVAYSAIDARRLGFEVTVIETACRGINVDGSLDASWQQMLDAGVIRA